MVWFLYIIIVIIIIMIIVIITHHHHHIDTSIGCWTRYMCTYKEIFKFLFSSHYREIANQDFYASINVYTVQLPPSPWFPYSRILVRGWEQPFTLSSPHSSIFFFIFFFRYQTHHYLRERIHFLWSNCVLFNYLIRKYLYIKTWDILSHPNYHYLYLIIMQLWYNGIVTAMSLHPFFFFSFTSSRNK